MNKENEKQTKKADFIDLEKSQFKTAKPYLVYLVITLLIVLSLLFFVPTLKSFFLDRNKLLKFENQNSKIYLDILDNEKYEHQSQIYSKNIDQGQEFLNIEKVNQKIEESTKKIETLKEKIIELERRLAEQLNTNNFYANKLEIDMLSKNNLKFYNFELFKKKLFDGEDYDEVLKELKFLFSKNQAITSLLDFFSSINLNEKISYTQLLSRIDNTLNESNRSNFYGRDKDYTNNNNFNMNETKGSIKDYFLELIKSHIRIKKVNSDNNLDDYTDQNNDGIMDIKNVLNTVRDSLIAKDLRRSLFLLDSVESPISLDIEAWKVDAKYLITIEEKFQILQQEIFKDLLKNR